MVNTTFLQLSGLLPLIPFLKDVKGFLLVTIVGEKTLAVVVVLNAVEDTARGTEILENPRGGACQTVYLVEHGTVLTIEILLELFCPTLVLGSMQTILSSTTELADDDGLVVGYLYLIMLMITRITPRIRL